VELTTVKHQIIPDLRKIGIIVDEMRIEADGGDSLKGRTYPVDLSALELDRPYFIYPGGPFDWMHYARVVLISKGREVHVTDSGFVEKLDFPKIDPSAFSTYPEPELRVPTYLAVRGGFDAAMIRLAGRLQHRNVVWTVSESSKNEPLRAAYDASGPHLRPFPDQEMNWTITYNNQKLIAERDDILTKGGAAFNQHSYFWRVTTQNLHWIQSRIGSSRSSLMVA
jgi:hypothetical protein